MIPVRDAIFICYTYDDEEHVRWVWALALNLRRQGLNVLIDLEANPVPEEPDEAIRNLLEFFPIHQRAAAIVPGGVFRARAELPDDKALPPRWRQYQANIYRFVAEIANCRYVLLVHTPRFYKETRLDFGQREAGVVLEEYLALHNSIAADPGRHRVISVLRAGDDFHYGPANSRYFHVDFRNDGGYACQLAILYNILRMPFEDEVWSTDVTPTSLQMLFPTRQRRVVELQTGDMLHFKATLLHQMIHPKADGDTAEWIAIRVLPLPS